MPIDPLAGKPAPRSLWVDVSKLVTAYFTRRPDPTAAAERVAFGTSGHRGSALRGAFNEAHILAITQAICEQRAGAGIRGPLFLGKDSHALSEPARQSALEVLAANGVEVRLDAAEGLTPTPVISHAILTHNRRLAADAPGRGDGIVITPSHNPPEDGGFKYDPPHGGPAEAAITAAIERRANRLLEAGLDGVKRLTVAKALAAATTGRHDYLGGYVGDLPQLIDLDRLRSAQLRLGVDPLGGASVAYWPRIAEQHRLDLTVVNPVVDPTFGFMRVDGDGKIRMDCSSPYAMAGLVELRSKFDLAFGNDTDADRHGVVAPSVGLLNPNHTLCVAIAHLFAQRPGWPETAAVGKTMVSSQLIDALAKRLGRPLLEVPVGFKWFVSGLHGGSLGFGGEESAGASFLRRNGEVWTTDKDGIAVNLLVAEAQAVAGRDPGEIYRDLTRELGDPAYQRLDAPLDPAQRAKLAALSEAQVKVTALGGEPIREKLTRAPGNGEPLGGLKVTAASGWFAVRPSGTEPLYKLYAESFRGPTHLAQIQAEAQTIVAAALE